MNQLLQKYGRNTFTRSIRAQLIGVPGSSNGDVFHRWAKLPIPREQWGRESSEKMRMQYPDCEPLPGAERLLSNLSRARNASSEDRIGLALATSSKSHTYELKTSNPRTERLLSFFHPDRRVLGDDPRLGEGRAKPAPDIYLVALQALNSAADFSDRPITPIECLVFEDSVVGVQLGDELE
jgi:pseudouridine-5'-monophosphatase